MAEKFCRAQEYVSEANRLKISRFLSNIKKKMWLLRATACLHNEKRWGWFSNEGKETISPQRLKG